MKFIIDAHLPPSLCGIFRNKGYDAIHTSELPAQNATSDQQITLIALAEDRTVITKDSDFWDSFVLRKQPRKLVLVKTGNISTADLKNVFEQHFDRLIQALSLHEVVILRKDSLEVFSS